MKKIIVVFLACSSFALQAQNKSLVAISDPNLASKQNAEKVYVSVEKSAVTNLETAYKYELNEIRAWRAKNTKVLFMEAIEYSKLDEAKLKEVKDNIIVYRSKIRWADIEQFIATK